MEYTYQRLAEVNYIFNDFAEDDLLMLHDKFSLKKEEMAKTCEICLVMYCAPIGPLTLLTMQELTRIINTYTLMGEHDEANFQMHVCSIFHTFCYTDAILTAETITLTKTAFKPLSPQSAFPNFFYSF